MSIALADNAPRYKVGSKCVESWFLRANDPKSPRSVWIKSTVLCRADGSAVAETWVSVFDGDRTSAARETVPIGDATITGGETPLVTEIAGTTMRLDSDGGTAVGSIDTESGKLAWDLTLARVPGFLGEPLSLLPTRKLIDAPVPKNKLLTPFPVASYSGSVTWDGAEWLIDDWFGMQGHNWGEAHSPEYAWGQCVFTDSQSRPFAMMEGASGRVQLGPVTTPLLSMLTVRRNGKEFRFDRLVDLWRQTPKLAFPKWQLRMRGRDGQALLTMIANPARMVCLGYDNPNGQRSYCLNSKTSEVTLNVKPANDDEFECR
ncbi:MAG: hypothetical protein U0904_05845, partial [Candidatus Nanopelagicales bacterium]|nr:hypothetical protein [Candidatus Nanopelagicales bacterium]